MLLLAAAAPSLVHGHGWMSDPMSRNLREKASAPEGLSWNANSGNGRWVARFPLFPVRQPGEPWTEPAAHPFPHPLAVCVCPHAGCGMWLQSRPRAPRTHWGKGVHPLPAKT